MSETGKYVSLTQIEKCETPVQPVMVSSQLSQVSALQGKFSMFDSKPDGGGKATVVNP